MGQQIRIFLHQNKPCGADKITVCVAFVIFCLWAFIILLLQYWEYERCLLFWKRQKRIRYFCLRLFQRCRCAAVDKRHETCRGRGGVMNRAKKQTFERHFLYKTQNLIRFVWSEEKGLTNGKESDKIDLQFTIC